VLDALSGVGQSAHKFGTDLRLLAHRQEVEEPFEAEQVGSSAMAYKRNPMRAERMCGLARFVINLANNAAQTAAVQWLERTLDDSVNRRLTLPQAFLATDGVLRLALNIGAGMTANAEVIARNVAAAFPYMATENLLLAAVARGGDRQEVHECIRRHSHPVTAALKAGQPTNELLERLRADPLFAGVAFDRVLAEGRFAGRAPQQVDEFLEEEVQPIRARYGHLLEQRAEPAV
jgi:adenylosuccinate lyase